MEGRVRKHGGQTSPESARAWVEPPVPPSLPPHAKLPPPPSPPQGWKIPVVYYLCRNRHLEHPHFIEVPLSSLDGLYLRDVINRLNMLRGKGMPAMYSWSCKRSYKNGFVWHDLAEDDLVLPANGNEYVLKGSELLDQSPSDRIHQSNGNPRLPNLKPQQQENSALSRTQEAAASSSSSPALTVLKDLKPSPSLPSPRDDEHSPLLRQPGLPTNISPDRGPRRPSSWENSSSVAAEYRAYKPVGAADASTQTEDGGGRNAHGSHATCIRGISTDDGSIDLEFEEKRWNRDMRSKEGSETGGYEISPAPTLSSESSSSGKTETLESLIRADAGKVNSFRILEEEEVLFDTGPKVRSTNVLMQLITCGSISVKDHHSFGLVPTYKPRFSHAKFPSPMFGGSMTLGEIDYLSEDPRLIRMRLDEKEYFSGSLIETKKHKDTVGQIMPTLKRSSSYNADRNSKTPDSKQDIEKLVDSSRSKCLPRAIKMTSNKQPKNEAHRSSISDGPRKSSVGQDCKELPIGEYQKITLSVNASSTSVESFKERKEKVIKIEERLMSGARVTIQSRAPCDDSEGGSDS
ncbi:protein SOSEKI 3-like isoform X2 [Musa acuminata AAA Group]|uniref:protein SOSEKI 3-like isoform X2 n=1 Tax=Musa acuminata AAA Group TaxID=214697 RepID=UPI0031E2CC86